MAKEYFWQEHSHVTVKHPGGRIAQREGWGGTFEIVLHTGNRVWVGGSYAHDLADGQVIQVGDGTSKGFDENGYCILSVPAEWCEYFTAEEAESIERMIDADAELLSYAR